jgi:hypothetical protein
MRKITSQKDKNKKKKLTIMIGGVLLIVIMFFSVLGYSFQGMINNDSKKITYNGFEFINQNGLWFSQVKNIDLVFSYNPKEVEKIISKVNSFESYFQNPLYIYSENQEAELEIYRNLDQHVLRRQYACPEQGGECEENWPIKSCKDNFILIEEGETSSITQTENCVFIKAPQENLTQITDEFLFKIFGIEE